MARRSLWPREHGAYFQLALPLLTACILRIPTPATVALAAGATVAFLANEPLLVVLGHRGARRKSTDGARARRRLAVLAGLSLVLGAVGLVLAPPAIIAAAIVAAPTAVLLGFAWRRAQHTVAGELVAAVALTGASTPVLVASGVSISLALELWLGWALGFGASVLAVHRVIARHKRPTTSIDRGLALSMVAVLAIGLATRHLAFAMAAPLVMLATGLVVSAPSAAKLRAIGVAIVIAGVASSVLVLVRC